jgi:hypothetical protein
VGDRIWERLPGAGANDSEGREFEKAAASDSDPGDAVGVGVRAGGAALPSAARKAASGSGVRGSMVIKYQ